MEHKRKKSIDIITIYDYQATPELLKFARDNGIEVIIRSPPTSDEYDAMSTSSTSSDEEENKTQQMSLTKSIHQLNTNDE
jgi:hypothetical protein